MRPSRILLLLLSITAGLDLVGQTNTGGLSGTVFDESGAVLPNVELTIRQENTSAQRVMHTDAKGRYSATQLSPGPYEITARPADFQTAVRQGIVVSVGREVIENISLKVGTASSEVIVQGDAELVDTRTAAVSGLMSNQLIASCR